MSPRLGKWKINSLELFLTLVSHFARRRDANHKELVAGLRSLPRCSVLDLGAVGAGCPDLLVGFRGINTLLEVKNPRHRRKSGSTNPTTGPKQAEFRARWSGSVHVVETLADALVAIGASFASLGAP